MLNKIQNLVFIPLISITIYFSQPYIEKFLITKRGVLLVTALVKVTLAEKGSVHSVFFVQT